MHHTSDVLMVSNNQILGNVVDMVLGFDARVRCSIKLS